MSDCYEYGLESEDISMSVDGECNVEMSLDNDYVFEVNVAGGTCPTNYNDLTDKPSINNVILSGNKTGAELGLVDAVEGQGLSDNNLTDELLNKLNAAASGGAGSSPLYLSNTNSDVAGYKRLSYTPDTVEVVKTITATNSTVYGETYLFDLPIGVDVIAAGQWIFDYWRSISSAAGESFSRLESFLRHQDGTETTTYFIESPSIENTSIEQRTINYALPQFNMLPTDRFGVRMALRTTRNAATVYSYIVGGQRGHSITIPIPPRHDYLRDKNGNLDYQHINNSERFEGGLATGIANPSPISGKDLSTVKKISDKVDDLIKNSGVVNNRAVSELNLDNILLTNSKMLETLNIIPILINLFDKDSTILGTIYSTSSNYIQVTPNTRYSSNKANAYIDFYDINKSFISEIAGTMSITTPINCYYMICRPANSDVNTYMVWKGYSAPPRYYSYLQGTYEYNIVLGSNYLQVGKNLFNKSSVTINRYIDKDTGALAVLTGYNASDYIEIESSTIYAYNYNGQTYAWYNIDKTYISGGTTSASLTSPNNAKYIRISVSDSQINTAQFEKGTVSVYQTYKKKFKDDYIPHKLLSIWNNLIMDTLGDSITYLASWQSTVVDRLGLASYNNHGISGATITASANSMTDNVVNVSSSADIVTVFGGTNDFMGNYPMGTLVNYGGTFNKSTFIGALQYICEYLINYMPTKRIILIAPYQQDYKTVSDAGFTLAANGYVKNSQGFTLEDYVNSILVVGKYYGLPTLDLYHTSGCNKLNILTYTYDKCHPSKYGGIVFGRQISKFIDTI